MTLPHDAHIDFQHSGEADQPIMISHFIRIVGSYMTTILLFLVAVGIAYAIAAVAAYLTAPSVRTTVQSFRLDFEGAGEGEYPNKTKFNIADIISGPILTRIYQENHLSDYLSHVDFSRSVFVLEFNRQYDQLASEFQAKLADPRLSLIDRERLQQEFEMKRRSITKNEYAIYFTRRGGRPLPEPLARKVLLDVLNGWADFAVNQQHVVTFNVSVLSPQFVAASAAEGENPVASIEVLRSKTRRVIGNIGRIERLPGANLARTPSDHGSLEEVKLRLDEIMRFRLEPLLGTVLHTQNLVVDRPSTIRFLESQLAYDERQLEATQRLADSVREAMSVYQQPVNTASVEPPNTANAPRNESTKPGNGEAVMPQLSDTFLDRLMSLTGRAGDAVYRQNMVDDYRHMVAETIPLKEAVAYDTQVLEELRKSSPGSTGLNPAAVKAQIDQTRQELADLIGKMNELFQVISRNMTSSAQLFTLTGPPVTQTLRAISLPRLALYGLLIELIAVPVIITICLLHHRIREERKAEEYAYNKQTSAS